MPSLTQAVAFAILGLALWNLFQMYLRWSRFYNIPGPKPSSFLTGECPQKLVVFVAYREAGHLDQILGNSNWKFLRTISSEYGSVAKLQTLFGVSKIPYGCSP